MHNSLSALIIGLLTCTAAAGQEARSFPHSVPPGNYSALAWLGDSTYVVADDKSPTDGFYTFFIQTDSVTGSVKSVHRGAFHSSNLAARDAEGICYNPYTHRVWMGGETDNTIREYALDGTLTGRVLPLSDSMRRTAANYGYESLSYNAVTHRYWTVTESTLPMDGESASSTNGVENKLRLQVFDDSLQAMRQWAYKMDTPASRRQASNYAMGVSEVCALDNGKVIVLEREFYVPKMKIGAWVTCKLDEVNPDREPLCQVNPDTPMPSDQRFLEKRQLSQWTTRLGLFSRDIANYEGMCLGPTLTDGRRLLLLVSDSQAGYAGVLKDWFMTIPLENK